MKNIDRKSANAVSVTLVEPSITDSLARRTEPASAIILTGGKGSRMGADKAFLDINGQPAANRLYKLLCPHFDEVFFATAAGRPCPVKGARCVHDTVEGKGPLAGLAAGLAASPCRVNFVIACDIPQFDVPLMRKMLSYMDEYKIVVPAFAGKPPEPLFGVYDRSVGETAQRLIAGGTLKVSALFFRHPTRIVAAADEGWYVNLNTPEEYHSYMLKIKKHGASTGRPVENITMNQ